MMRPPVIAIGLDAADPILLERWMAQGQLPTLAALRARGAYGRLANFDYCRAEAACTSFLTGCSAWQTGRWTPFAFDPSTYSVRERQAYEFEEYPPFYALGDKYTSVIFDLPQTRISEDVKGIQVLGWGAHSPRTPRDSRPRGLGEELAARHGDHPTYEKDHVTLWDRPAMERLEQGLKTGIARRGAICSELLQQQPCDFFITYFGETHSAGHFFWHLSQTDHPLHTVARWRYDPLLTVFRAVDEALAAIVAAAPRNARFVLFSDHGMEANSTDLPSLVFLPELLFRWNFPGQHGLQSPSSSRPVPPPVLPRAGRSWTDEVWGQKQDGNPVTRALRQRLPVTFFHYTIEKRLGLAGLPLCPEDCPLGSQPPMWYHPAWPRMKAFALPSFSEGYIRLNVRGRDRDGIIEPRDYDAVLSEVESLLREVRDARTGAPMVARMMRPRASATDGDPKLPDADLIVVWTAVPADTVETPYGRIGPLPFNRTGSHVERGFLLASGPGITPGSTIDGAHALDLAPTILQMLDAPVPAYMAGKRLFASPTPIPV